MNQEQLFAIELAHTLIVSISNSEGTLEAAMDGGSIGSGGSYYSEDGGPVDDVVPDDGQNSEPPMDEGSVVSAGSCHSEGAGSVMSGSVGSQHSFSQHSGSAAGDIEDVAQHGSDSLFPKSIDGFGEFAGEVSTASGFDREEHQSSKSLGVHTSSFKSRGNSVDSDMFSEPDFSAAASMGTTLSSNALATSSATPKGDASGFDSDVFSEPEFPGSVTKGRDPLNMSVETLLGTANLQRQIAQLQKSLQTLTNQTQSLSIELGYKAKQVDELSSARRELENSLIDTKAEMRIGQKEVAKANERMSQLEAKHSQMKKELETSLIDTKSEPLAFQKGAAMAGEQMSVLAKENASLQSPGFDGSEVDAVGQQKHEQVCSERDSLRMSLRKSRSDLDEAQKMIASVAAEKSALSQQVAWLEARIETLRRDGVSKNRASESPSSRNIKVLDRRTSEDVARESEAKILACEEKMFNCETDIAES